MKRLITIAVLAILAVIAVILLTPEEAISGQNCVLPEGQILATSTEAVVIDDRGARIDAYFEKRGMPLAGRGDLFVAKADEYGIEWNLLAAISVAESTGGKHMCQNNPFGWGSCRIVFDTIDEAIDTVSRNLGGHNPRTARAYAGGSDDDLWSYNGTVDPTYPGRVKAIMQAIAAETVDITQSK